MICASEDVGMADPRALMVAVAAAETVERVGMPEGRIPLAQAAVYVATAPKSNASYLAVDRALEAVDRVAIEKVPPHLTNAPIEGMKDFGRGVGYKYAHDFPGHYVRQQYLPDELEGTKFFEPGNNGYEKDIKKYMEFLSHLV